MPRLFVRSLLLSALAFAACSPSGPEELKSSLQRDTKPAASASDLASAASSARGFAVDLYKQLSPQKQNLFFSPHSIVEALMMTYAGARGETATQMREVLHLALADAQIHAAMNGLDLALTSRGQGQAGTNGMPFRLAVANALWGQTGFHFEPTFLDTIAVNYGGGLNLVDFSHATEKARVQINDWVAQQTADKIQDLLQPGVLTADSRLVLTNAVYFDAAWAQPFDAKDTVSAPFRKADGTSISVPTMNHTVDSGYSVYQAAGVTAVALPYAGAELEMVLISPDDLAAFEGGLTQNGIDQILSGLHPAGVTLHMPKWRFTDSTSLSDPLKALGMHDAFDAADFSGIDGQTDLVISDVVHKAFVAVDEAGTEAAAATAVVVGLTSAPTEGPIDIRIDHPFLFLIRDVATGAVVFVGRVVDPGA